MSDSKFTGMRIPPVLRGRINRQADICGLTVSDFCRRLLDAGVSRLESECGNAEDRATMGVRADQIDLSLASMARTGMTAETESVVARTPEVVE